MRIGGFVPLSLVDYPDRPCITLFTSGCNLRCPFCHNGDLVTGKEEDCQETVLKLLRQRRDTLKAVCISGGEPTIQVDLDEFITWVRALGYTVKLDTNGSRPEVIGRLLTDDLLDYVAIDVKASPQRYEQATGGELSFDVVAETVKVVKASGAAYELRTTAVPGLVDLEALEVIVGRLGPMERFALQQFRPIQTLDPAYRGIKPYPGSWFEEAKDMLHDRAGEIILRGI